MSHLELPCLPVVGSSTLVPLVNGTSVPYANLDGAASAPALEAVARRVNQVLPLYASVHRGAGYLSQVSTALYEASRRTIGEFVGARDTDETIITRNTTDSLNLLAGCLPVGKDGKPGRVLVLDVEHHANLLPWQRAAGGATVLPAGVSVSETLDLLAAELARREYVLVAITGASNVTGESLPIPELVAIVHAAGARIALDGAQLIPHRRFSLAQTGVDYVAFSGHKTYAPYGSGVLIGRRDWLDRGTPYLAGGGAVSQVGVDYVTWAPAPARHEGGSPNVIGTVALAAACETLAAVDPTILAAHEDFLRNRLVAGLEEIPQVQVVTAWADAVNPVGVVTFVVTGSDPGLVAAYLSAEHGIGVRDGRFCAHPLLKRLGFDSGAIRASVGVGTSAAEVDRLISALKLWTREGVHANYEVVDGCWGVKNDPRPTPQGLGLDALIATAAADLGAGIVSCGPAPRVPVGV